MPDTRARALLAAIAVSMIMPAGGKVSAQNTPVAEPQPLLPFDAPKLVPESLLEPEPIVVQPNLLPTEALQMSVRRAEMIERRSPSIMSNDELQPQELDGGAASAFGPQMAARSFMRPAIAETQAERELQRIVARGERLSSLEHYNVKIGPIPFRFGAGIEFHFSDNVDLTSENKTADLSIFPHFDIYGGIRISRWNTLSIQLGVGYIWNLNRPELDRALTNASIGLDSDSGISFDIKIGNFHINLHERPAIPRQQFDLVTQRSPLQYSQFTNLVGISVLWDINSRLSASFQYDHLNVISLKSDVESLDQASDLFGASASYRFERGIALGVQASASYINYKRAFLNDSENYDAGVTLTAPVTRSTIVRVVAGYQVGSFGSGGEIDDQTDVGDWYCRVAITHKLNRFVSQTLHLGHEARVGTASNAVETNYIRHQVNFSLARSFGLGTHASFDSASESGGSFAQDFKLYQLGLFGYWTLSKTISLSLNCAFTKRDAQGDGNGDVGVLDYVENRIDLGVQVSM